MTFEPEQSNTRDLASLSLKRTNESFLENASVSVSLSWLFQQAVQNLLFVVALSHKFTKGLFMVWILRESFAKHFSLVSD